MGKTAKRAWAIVSTVLIAAALSIPSFYFGNRLGTKKEAEKHAYVMCNGYFTDMTTGLIYRVRGNDALEVHVSYDEDVCHTFVFQAFAEPPHGKRVAVNSPREVTPYIPRRIHQPGEYEFTCNTAYHRYHFKYKFIFVIEDAGTTEEEQEL